MSASARKRDPLIGFLGQGTVGKSYADDFENRGYETVRYALERPFRINKHKVKNADVVFVCVPTPTTPSGFDASIVEESLSIVGEGKIAVIKSTILPGTTRHMQRKFPLITVLCSPELLQVSTAMNDAAKPFLTLVGIPKKSVKHRAAAKLVHSILPSAPFKNTCASEVAEIFKYAHNVYGYMQVLACNLMYDVVRELRGDWGPIRAALDADPMISNWYIDPVHKGGRGAGGPCFIKDFAAFAAFYAECVARPEGKLLLQAAQTFNVALLAETNKDMPLIKEVYGREMTV